MIKHITITEFENDVRNVMFDVLAAGDTLHVDCGEAGAFVVVDEEKYNLQK